MNIKDFVQVPAIDNAVGNNLVNQLTEARAISRQLGNEVSYTQTVFNTSVNTFLFLFIWFTFDTLF